MIEITVKGCAGTGKSSIAYLIMSKLMEEGFDKIELDMLDTVNSDWFDKNQLRIQTIKEENQPIKITEKMTRI